MWPSCCLCAVSSGVLPGSGTSGSAVRSPEDVAVTACDQRDVRNALELIKAAGQRSLENGFGSIILSTPTWARPTCGSLHSRDLNSLGSLSHPTARAAIHASIVLPLRDIECQDATSRCLLPTELIRAARQGATSTSRHEACPSVVCFYARHDARHIALPGSRLVDKHPAFAVQLFGPAGGTMGHGARATEDLRALGRTCAETEALGPNSPCARTIALDWWCPAHANPIGRFGWMFVLECPYTPACGPTDASRGGHAAWPALPVAPCPRSPRMPSRNRSPRRSTPVALVGRPSTMSAEGLSARVPAAVAAAWSDRSRERITCAVSWGGFMRKFALAHITSVVDPIGHMYGTKAASRPVSIDGGESRNQPIIGLLALGGGWDADRYTNARGRSTDTAGCSRTSAN